MSKFYSTYSDLELFTLVKQGNEYCFQEIYHRYWERLFSFVYNRLHRVETSKEIIQDVFSSLWIKRDGIEVTSSLSGYLFGAARNRMLNELRSDKVRETYAADFSYFINQQVDNSNAEYQNLKDLEKAIEASIAVLPEKCRVVFRLSRQENLPIPNIAERLNISTRTVENYLTQALKHLRMNLGEFIALLIIGISLTL